MSPNQMYQTINWTQSCIVDKTAKLFRKTHSFKKYMLWDSSGPILRAREAMFLCLPGSQGASIGKGYDYDGYSKNWSVGYQRYDKI